MAAVAASSNIDSTPAQPRPLQLTPGFSWTGSEDAFGNASNVQLSRVYVFSDKQCLNPVHDRIGRRRPGLGASRQRPARSCRSHDRGSRPDANGGTFLGFGAQTSDLRRRRRQCPCLPRRHGRRSRGARSHPLRLAAARGSRIDSGTCGRPDAREPPRHLAARQRVAAGPLLVDRRPRAGLRQRSSRQRTPSSRATPSSTTTCSSRRTSVRPDRSGPSASRAPRSRPRAQNPYVSGVVTGTRVVSATARRPTFQQLPLITWQPALAAQSYEIEVSRHAYPWDAVHEADLRRHLGGAPADRARTWASGTTACAG